MIGNEDSVHLQTHTMKKTGTALSRHTSIGPCLMALVMLGICPGAYPQVFNADATEACVAQAEANSPSRGSFAVLACVGQSAQVCTNQPRQDNTLGMMECLDSENTYWQERMAAALADSHAAAERADGDKPLYRSNRLAVVEQLSAMQEAWEKYRDAACLYEQALWLGGSGGQPATMACHMAETARQTLKLEGWWQQ